MKLLFCKSCQDIVKLPIMKFRKCQCGKSRGRYLKDEYHAEIQGEHAIPICFLNSTLAAAIRCRPKSGNGMEFVAFVAAEDHPSVKYLP